MKTEVKLPKESGLAAPSSPASSNTPKPEKQKPKSQPSPFKKAKTIAKRLKLFIWGDTSTGKTILALQFPKPAVIDLERGTDLYAGKHNFEVLKASTADEVIAAVDWLLTNPHQYRTLVIDPVTILWESLQKKWSDIFLRRNKGSKGYKFDFYDLQPKDWMTIKAELKDFIRKLIALDMNVIVIAREKVKYKDGGYMVPVGETFDAEKSLPYMFDTIVRLFRDEQGKYMARCLKDRSNRLPKKDFECSYAVFEKLFGKENLNRQAKPVEYATDAQKQTIRDFIKQFDLTSKQVNKRLAAYDADSLDDLTKQNAEIIIGKFESALSTKQSTTGGDNDAKN